MFADNPALRRVAIVGGGIVGLAIIIAIAISTVNSGSETVETRAHGEVTLTGDALPLYDPSGSQDPALGKVAPTVTGESLDKSETITIGPDGRTKIVLFLAHWCPHCQAEVPAVVSYLQANPLPENVDLYGVSTLAERLRANFPPQKWLERENWEFPTILDGEDDPVQAAYGLLGTPFWVVLDGDNRVVARVSGSIPPESLGEIFDLAASVPSTQTRAPSTTVVVDTEEMLP